LKEVADNDEKLLATVKDAASEVEKEVIVMLKNGITEIAKENAEKIPDRDQIDNELFKMDMKKQIDSVKSNMIS